MFKIQTDSGSFHWAKIFEAEFIVLQNFAIVKRKARNNLSDLWQRFVWPRQLACFEASVSEAGYCVPESRLSNALDSVTPGRGWDARSMNYFLNSNCNTMAGMQGILFTLYTTLCGQWWKVIQNVNFSLVRLPRSFQQCFSFCSEIIQGKQNKSKFLCKEDIKIRTFWDGDKAQSDGQFVG